MADVSKLPVEVWISLLALCFILSAWVGAWIDGGFDSAPQPQRVVVELPIPYQPLCQILGAYAR